MKKRVVFLSLVGVALSSLSCSDSNFEKYVKLGKLRVLAMRAGPVGGPGPELSPAAGTDAASLAAATVSITPLVTDLNGGTRGLTYTAEACLDPGTSIGADPTCEGAATRQVLKSDVSFTLTDAYRTGDAPSFTVTVPAGFLDAFANDATLLANGVPLLVTYEVKAGSDSVRAYKKILVTPATKTPKNTNPPAPVILADSLAFSGFPAGKPKLKAELPETARESYTQVTTGVSSSKQEELTTTWFISDGELKYTRTVDGDTTEYTPPGTKPTGRGILVLAVTRDERGGVAWSSVEPCGTGGAICP